MRNYEIVTIFHPELDDAALTVAVEKIKSWVTESGGVVSNIEQWGKRRLAYHIRKQRDGKYVMFNIQMDPALASELDRNMRFLEPVLRYMTTLVD
jgi:small subunit ribosomal protein S6